MIESFGFKDSPSNPASKLKRCQPHTGDQTEKIIKKICFESDQSAVIKRDAALIRVKRQSQKEIKINSSYVLGQFNSIEIKNNTIINKLDKPTDFEMEQGTRNEMIICKCKKTKCSKMYCECFANGQECSFRCECTGCSNKIRKSTPTQQIIPLDYQGCNCKKQDCSKKYCECLKRNVKCTSKCKCCEDCKNYSFSPLPFNLDA